MCRVIVSEQPSSRLLCSDLTVSRIKFSGAHQSTRLLNLSPGLPTVTQVRILRLRRTVTCTQHAFTRDLDPPVACHTSLPHDPTLKMTTFREDKCSGFSLRDTAPIYSPLVLHPLLTYSTCKCLGTTRLQVYV